MPHVTSQCVLCWTHVHLEGIDGCNNVRVIYEPVIPHLVIFSRNCSEVDFGEMYVFTSTHVVELYLHPPGDRRETGGAIEGGGGVEGGRGAGGA